MGFNHVYNRSTKVTKKEVQGVFYLKRPKGLDVQVGNVLTQRLGNDSIRLLLGGRGEI